MEERKVLNLDNNLWGDYDVNGDEDDIDEDVPSVEQPSDQDSSASEDSLGGVDSIRLRIRLFRLVSGVRTTRKRQTGHS